MSARRTVRGAGGQRRASVGVCARRYARGALQANVTGGLILFSEARSRDVQWPSPPRPPLLFWPLPPLLFEPPSLLLGFEVVSPERVAVVVLGVSPPLLRTTSAGVGCGVACARTVAGAGVA